MRHHMKGVDYEQGTLTHHEQVRTATVDTAPTPAPHTYHTWHTYHINNRHHDDDRKRIHTTCLVLVSSKANWTTLYDDIKYKRKANGHNSSLCLLWWDSHWYNTSLLTTAGIQGDERWGEMECAVSGCMQQHEAQTQMATERAMHILCFVFSSANGWDGYQWWVTNHAAAMQHGGRRALRVGDTEKETRTTQ